MPDIEVIIRKGTSADGVSQTEASSSAAGEAQVSSAEGGRTSVQQDAVSLALIEYGKQVIRQMPQAYANLTGDYYSAEVIQSAATIFTDLAIVYKTGGVGAVYVAGKYALQIGNGFINDFRKKEEHNFTRERLGRISMRGSRY